MDSLLILFVVFMVALISPGPDFALIVRLSLTRGHRSGIAAALGIAVGVAIYTLITLGGLQLLFIKWPLLQTLIALAGAAFLFYLGLQGVRSKPISTEGAQTQAGISDEKDQSFWMGLATNLLNPKAWVFFSAVFAQFADQDRQFLSLALVGVFVITAGWFSLVALVLARFQQALLKHQHWVERTVGTLFILLALQFLFQAFVDIQSISV